MLINQLKEELGLHWKLLLALLIIGVCVALGALVAGLAGVTGVGSLIIAGIVAGAIAGGAVFFYNLFYLVTRRLDDRAYQAGSIHNYWKGITGTLASLAVGLGAGLIAGLYAPAIPALAALTLLGITPLAFLASPLIGPVVAATVVACISFAAVAGSFLLLRAIYKATCTIDNKYNKDYDRYNSNNAEQTANWFNEPCQDLDSATKKKLTNVMNTQPAAKSREKCLSRFFPNNGSPPKEDIQDVMDRMVNKS